MRIAPMPAVHATDFLAVHAPYRLHTEPHGEILEGGRVDDRGALLRMITGQRV